MIAFMIKSQKAPCQEFTQILYQIAKTVEYSPLQFLENKYSVEEFCIFLLSKKVGDGEQHKSIKYSPKTYI